MRTRALPGLVAAAVAVLATTGCLGSGTAGSGAGRTPGGTSGGASSATPAGTPTEPGERADGCAVDQQGLATELRALERARGALVGVHALDTGSGTRLGHRADERFAFASTIKALAAAEVLDRLDRKGLDRRVRWEESDLVTYSPVTELHVADGLTVRQLLEAAVTVSDNTAANLLLDLLGGPRALDEALEDLGDDVTEVVRPEPALNEYTPGDVRDTTTPRALATSLAAYAVQGRLSPPDRRVLLDLLERSTTGDALVRAGVPRDWRVGDKSGTAAYGTRNDVAVLTPPGRAPVVLAVMTRHAGADAAADDRLVSLATRAVVRALCP